MQWLKKAVMFIGIGVLAMSAVPSVTRAEETQSLADYLVIEEDIKKATIKDGESDSLVKRSGANYTTRYDPRSVGAVSRVENQGQTETCWAFATIAAIESNLIKKGYENPDVDLSENHLAYFFYNRQVDPLNNTDGDRNGVISFKHWAQNGGSLRGTALSLNTWSGVVKATTTEDDSTGAYLPTDLPGDACYNHDYVVKNTYFYDYSVNEVKQAIIDHGAVSVGISATRSFWNEDTDSFYSPYDEANHAVAIIGWDDSYSRNNFNAGYRPKSNGAWIVKNSYGPSFGDNGFMYVSYEDASLCEVVAYDMERYGESCDNVYQYDGTANPIYTFMLPNEMPCANVFRTKASPAGYNEILEAVGIFVFSENVQYSLQVYTGVTGSTNPTKGKAMFSEPQTGRLENAGYHRIKLEKPVTLTAGEKYSVVFTLSSMSGASVKLGVESDLYDIIHFETDVDEGVGFIKQNGKWFDCGDAIDMANNRVSNLRIKAFTRNTQQKTTYALSGKNIGISKGSSEKLSLNITPSSVKRKVTWSSSNKSVATVSSSGKVTAKKYGTTTIKAKFVAGSKTKTLSCKVTVGPSKVQSFKVKKKNKKVTITWKRNSEANGYAVYYSDEENGKYKTLTTINKNSKTKVTKKLKAGTYYIKMRPYIVKGGKKLYGSDTSAKKIVIK